MLRLPTELPNEANDRNNRRAKSLPFLLSRTTSALAFAALLLASSSFALARGKKHSNQGEANTPGVFDYYALSLGWAPTYCAKHQDDQSECSAGKQFGFVLHGLWPQFMRKWPENCSTATLTSEEKSKYGSIYPSEKLMEHEWAKHGTCSGLPASDYFDLSDSLRKGVKIPPPYEAPNTAFRATSEELEEAFRKANPDIKEGGVLAVCTGKFLSEVHVCFSKDGKDYATCSESETTTSRKSCKGAFLVRSVR